MFAQQILDGIEENQGRSHPRGSCGAWSTRACERAKDVFIRSYLRLVVAVARRYPRSGCRARPDPGGQRRPGRAVEKFDYRKGSSSRRTRPGGSVRPSPGR
ncbi:hypothetical protein GCM10023238_15590 [Streptomyces heliomycini]